MGLLDRLAVRARSDPPTAARRAEGTGEQIVVRVVEDTHTFEGDDGQRIWCGGLSPVGEDGHFLSEAEHRTSDPRAFVCKVAGAQHYPGVLDDPRIGPGSPVVLRPEPDNPYDKNAVGVWGVVDGDHVGQLGHVPATLCPEIAAILRAGTQMGGQVLREFRLGSSRGKRIGVHVLIAPAGPVSLVIEDDD